MMMRQGGRRNCLHQIKEKLSPKSPDLSTTALADGYPKLAKIIKFLLYLQRLMFNTTHVGTLPSETWLSASTLTN